MSIDALNWALNRAPVADSTQAFVLVCLADYAHAETMRCHPSIARVAQRARCSESTARRAIRSLEQAGLVVREKSAGGRSTNVYRIVMIEPGQNDTPTAETHRARTTSPAKTPVIHRASEQPGQNDTPQVEPCHPRQGTPGASDTPALAPVTPEPLMNHQTTASRHDERRRRIGELERECRTAGLSARFDKITDAEVDVISEMITAHGIDRLVNVARQLHRNDNPARSVKAWIPAWQALPVKSSSDHAKPARSPIAACDVCDEFGWIIDYDNGNDVRCDHGRSSGAAR